MASIPKLPRRLFEQASRSVRSEALRQMRSSPLGRGFTEMQREIRRTNRSAKKLGSLQTGIRRATQRGLVSGVRQLTLRQLERYARKNPTLKILSSFFDALGPFGQVLRTLIGPLKENKGALQESLGAATSLLRAFGFEVLAPPGRGETPANLDRMAELLRQHGYKVEKDAAGKPGIGAQTEPQPRKLPGGITRPLRRKTVDFPLPDGGTKRIRTDDPLFTGELVRVQSSNVHSIGFVLNPNNPQSGTLRVRFWQQAGKDKARTAGPLYEYYHVDSELFLRFKRAGSPGGFVWDELRQRGTVSGHQYDYRLKGISGGYVPRKATFGAFVDPATGVMSWGESFKSRRFTTRGGKTFRSSLPEQRVSFLQTGAPNTGMPRAA